MAEAATDEEERAGAGGFSSPTRASVDVSLPMPLSIPEHSQSTGAHDATELREQSPNRHTYLAPTKTASADGITVLEAMEDHSSSPMRPSFEVVSATAAAKLAGNTPRSPHRAGKVSSPSSSSSDSSRGFCTTCMQCGRPERQRSPRRVKKWETEKEYKALFWFKSPRLMLRIFQCVTFDAATLSVAVTGSQLS